MKTVLTGGKFNRIHPGHLWLLKKAKEFGKLIVVLANDAHNQRAYAISARARKKNMEALGIADKVVVGDKKSFVKVVKKFHPAIIVLGYDQKIPDKETEKYIATQKIKIMKFRKHGNYGTRNL